MKFKVSWLQRLLQRFWDWADPKLGLPTQDVVNGENDSWDYTQTDRQAAWNAEDEPDSLSQALSLRYTDPEKAFKSLLALAEAGSAIAMNEIGECYYWARLGAKQSESQAELWFERAFRAGSQRALLSYGKLLRWRGDEKAAEAVFRTGAVEDWAPALYWLARTRLNQSNTADARSEVRVLLERAAAKGHPSARLLLGREMAWGRFGLQRIPAGFRMLSGYAKDVIAAWEGRTPTVRRKTQSGATLH